MKTKRNLQTAVCFAAVLACTGCTITYFDLTGTKGAKFRGEVSQSYGTSPWVGNLPADNWQASLGIIGFNRLQSCEFLKDDTNAVLVLRLKTHGFKGSIAAPPGTAGVRVVRVGKNLKAETLCVPANKPSAQLQGPPSTNTK